jgi:hypothetical protein
MVRAAVVVFLMGLASLLGVAERGKLDFVGMALAGHNNNNCTLASLKGGYGLDGQGTAFITPPGIPSPAQEVDIGFFTADGKGNLVGSVTINLNSIANTTISLITTTAITGSYVVNVDCTATITIHDSLGETLKHEGVIFDGGRVVRMIQTDVGQVFARVARSLSD